MKIIPGKKKGSKVLFHDGCTYARDFQSNHIFRCSKRKSANCKAYLEFKKIIFDIEDCLGLKEGKDYFVRNGHSHLDEKDKDKWSVLLQAMIKRAVETNDGLKEIFDDVVRPFPDIAAEHNYNSCSSILSRAREASRKKIPDTLPKLGEILKDNDIATDFVQKNGQTAIIFTRNTLLNVLNNSNEIYMDGTYENVSLKPKIEQLYTIHARVNDTYIATVMVLMERRNADLYSAVFEWIREKAPKLEKNKKLIILTDYEKATIKALRKNFPVAQIHGCYFHYCQALIKRWIKMGIAIPESFLSMCLVIPLLPAKLFAKAELILREIISENGWDTADPKILSYLTYLHKTWLVHSEHVSVFECPSLTTDGAESFHRHNKDKLGGRHPCAWKLADGIEKVLLDEEINYKRLLTTAMPPKRRTPQHVIDRMNYINNLKKTIQRHQERFDIKIYLRMMPKSIKELLFTLKYIIGDDINFIDFDDSVPNEFDIPQKNEVKGDFNKLVKQVEEMIPPKSSNPFRKLRVSKTFPSSQNKCSSDSPKEAHQLSTLRSKLSNPPQKKNSVKSTEPHSSKHQHQQSVTQSMPSVSKNLCERPTSSTKIIKTAVKSSTETTLPATSLPEFINSSQIKKGVKIMQPHQYKLNLPVTQSKLISKYFSGTTTSPTKTTKKPIESSSATPQSLGLFNKTSVPSTIPLNSDNTFLNCNQPAISKRQVIFNGKLMNLTPINSTSIDLSRFKKVSTSASIPLTDVTQIINKFNATKENCENHLSNLAARFNKRKLPHDKWLRETKKQKKERKEKEKEDARNFEDKI